jgi:hypothetical protein
LADGAKEIMWLWNLLADMHIPQEGPTMLFCDNQSSIKLVKNPIYHARTKHIEIEHRYIREHVTIGDVEVAYIPTTKQEPDMLTKPMGRLKFAESRRQLGLTNLDELIYYQIFLTSANKNHQ